MGRNVGRHADRDTAGTVDEKIWKFRRQDARLLQAVIVVGFEVDRFVAEIVEQEHRNFCQPRFGIALGGRWIAIDRAEVALAIDQRYAQRKILRHTHQRVVDR